MVMVAVLAGVPCVMTYCTSAFVALPTCLLAKAWVAVIPLPVAKATRVGALMATTRLATGVGAKFGAAWLTGKATPTKSKIKAIANTPKVLVMELWVIRFTVKLW